MEHKEHKHKQAVLVTGGEYFDIELCWETVKAAANVNARIKAGVSGSTDLMLHVSQHVALGADDLKDCVYFLGGPGPGDTTFDVTATADLSTRGGRWSSTKRLRSSRWP